MLALVIVAVALSMITNAADRFTASAQLRDQTMAHWVALNQITEMRLQEQWPDLGDDNGTVEYADLEWIWESTVTETEVPELRRIDVDVFFPETETSLASLSGFIGQTRPSTTAPLPWGTATNSSQNGQNPNNPGNQNNNNNNNNTGGGGSNGEGDP